MRASKRSLKGFLVLLVIATMVVPGAANAAAPNPVSDVIVFGNKVPDFAPWGVNGDPDWNNPATGYNTVFANSKPLDQVSLGGVYYMGVADPEVIVDIEITDGVKTLKTSTWTAPNGSSLAIDGYEPGWFGLWVPSGFPRPTQDDNNVLYVNELGVHEAETDPAINPDGSASTDPAHWGPSAISFNFIARNPATNETALAVSRSITKYAGTPDDVTNPVILRNISYPPEHWCHLAGRGANDPFFGGSLGGQQNGSCSDLAQAPFGAVPDVTWVFCTRELSNPHQIVMPSLPSNPFRSFYCGDPAITGGAGRELHPNEYPPTGEAQIQGVFTDAPVGARGISSEIASISVKVFQGDALWMDLTPEMQVFRAGPTMGFGVKLRIQDLVPNYPTGELYQVRVEWIDAWGRVATHASPEITVYPY